MALIDARPTPLAQLRGLTAAEVAKLKAAGISHNEQLLAQANTRHAEVKLARSTDIPLGRMREAVNRADLVRLDGIGPATADLFENAGVNSLKELAQRNPASLHASLAQYAASRAELGYQVPSADQVKDFVTKAKAVTQPAPMKTEQEIASDALHSHVETVLFSDHPDGEAFRSNILDGHPPELVAQIKNEMHTKVAEFFSSPETEIYDRPQDITWAGRWNQLYTEVTINKATKSVGRVYVEID